MFNGIPWTQPKYIAGHTEIIINGRDFVCAIKNLRARRVRHTDCTIANIICAKIGDHRAAIAL